MTDNFADTPQSITEIKAERAHDGSIWTPRDAVVSWLRDFDNGKIEDCNSLIIIFNRKVEGSKKPKASYYQASEDSHKVFGMMEVVKHYLIND